MRITKKMAKEILEVLDEIRKNMFEGRKREYPFNEWERKRELVRQRLEKLPELIEEAASMVKIASKRGRNKRMNLEERTSLLLFAKVFGKSNRDMELMITMLKPVFKTSVSYKTIERLYSDEEVKSCLYNLFVLLLKEEGTSGKYAGDGTGYTLSITKHYASNTKKKGKDFRYTFRVIDLETNLCVAFGYSNHSEKEAFEKAMKMLDECDIEIESMRLDKYYSSRKVIRYFGREISLYLLPKKNISKVGVEWYRIFKKILCDPIEFLSNYFKRNLCESSFSSDKRRFGWIIRQKRDDRIELALFVITILHNIFAIRVKVS